MGSKEEPRCVLGRQNWRPLYERYITSVGTSLWCHGCIVAYAMNDFEGLAHLPTSHESIIQYHGEAKIPQKVLQKRSEERERKADVGPTVSKDTIIAHR